MKTLHYYVLPSLNKVFLILTTRGQSIKAAGTTTVQAHITAP